MGNPTSSDPRPPTPTYYGRPALKPSHWDWPIVTYFFLGGLAGAAQVIAAVVDLVGHERDRAVVRSGRYLALLGSLASPVLLIVDLHTPSRWYNMLRIFRPTSPMSIGAWVLAVFGTFSGLAAIAQALEDLTGGRTARRLGRWLGLPAAAAGPLMATYTGTLLSATSTPLWAAGGRLLGALFGASATSSAVAAISLWLEATDAPIATRHRLQRLGFVAKGTDFLLSRAVEWQWRNRGVAEPVERGALRSAHRYGVVGVGGVVPLLMLALQGVTGHHSRRASALAATATLIGGYVERSILVFGGRESAVRPEDYFRYAQSEGRGASHGE